MTTKTGHPVSMRLSAEALRDIDFLAARLQRKKTHLIEQAVQEMAEREREKMRLAGETEADAPPPDRITSAAALTKEFVDTDEAATLLGVNPQTVREYGLSGKLRRYNSHRPGRGFLYLRADVEALAQPEPDDKKSEFVTRTTAARILGRRPDSIDTLLAEGTLTDYREAGSRFPRLKREQVMSLKK